MKAVRGKLTQSLWNIWKFLTNISKMNLLKPICTKNLAVLKFAFELWLFMVMHGKFTKMEIQHMGNEYPRHETWTRDNSNSTPNVVNAFPILASSSYFNIFFWEAFNTIKFWCLNKENPCTKTSQKADRAENTTSNNHSHWVARGHSICTVDRK